MNELTYRNELPFNLKSFKKAFQSLRAMFDSMTRSRSTNERRRTHILLDLKVHKVRISDFKFYRE